MLIGPGVDVARQISFNFFIPPTEGNRAAKPEYSYELVQEIAVPYPNVKYLCPK